MESPFGRHVYLVPVLGASYSLTVSEMNMAKKKKTKHTRIIS
jgi:hypothetical protein